MKVIIAAAGTAGHINPGVAIANKIKKEQKEATIIFIGTQRGLENDLVPRAGYELKTIEAYGLSKKISIDNLKKMVKTMRGFSQARKIIKEFQPDIVIGTGGYICGATISEASKLKIPTMLHESNAFPGRAVKMLAKKTDTVLVSFEDAIPRIPKAKNVVWSGTPVKNQKRDYGTQQKNTIISEIGLKPDKPIILVFGGSQGALKINQTLLEIVKNGTNQDYQIMWATGPKQYEDMKRELEQNQIDCSHIENTKMVPYIYQMEEMMNIADLVVARSGAMTITEIANLGKPSILIPLPNVSHNHQLYNAQVLEKQNAAKIILDNDLTPTILHQTIQEILKKNQIQMMGQNAMKLATKNAEDIIYAEIEKLVKEEKYVKKHTI